MIFSGPKCFTISLLIFISFIVIAESKKKVETPKKEDGDENTLVTETVIIEVDESPKQEIEELEKLEKEDEAQQAAETKKELEELQEALTEASKDLAEFEKIAEEMNTKSPKEIEEEEKSKESEKSAEESESSTSETNPEETGENKNSSSSNPAITTIEKQAAPEDTFAVWNTKGKICLLAKFDATFSIHYASEGGEQKAEIKLPRNANVKGKCETTTRAPLLQLSWQKYIFSVMFNKTEEEDNWVVTSMELTYDTSEGLFDKATNAGKKTARSKPLSMFETPVKRSHFCPAQETVLLFMANKQAVTAKLYDVHLQAYGVEDAEFSPAYRCNKVVLDAEALVQDETVPLAVGLTFGLIALIVLVGFSIHRAINAAKADYNTVP